MSKQDYCEICSDKGIIVPAFHFYLYMNRKHKYCEKHFQEFCKMVADEIKEPYVIITQAALDGYSGEIKRHKDIIQINRAAVERANNRANTESNKRQNAEYRLEQFQTILKDLLTDNFDDYNKGDGW